MRTILRWALGWLLALTAAALAQPAAETGVGLTPAHFPHHTADDVARMYQLATRLGSVAVLNFRWDDPNFGRVAEQMLQLAEQDHLQPVVQLDILQPGGHALAPPPGVGQSFDAAFVDAYGRAVRQLAEQQPAYLAIATDINRLLAESPDRLAAFAQAYKRVYRMAKQVSPNTKVFVTFNWDIFHNAAASHHVPPGALRQFVDLFRPQLDVLAFSSTPIEAAADPAALPADYFAGIAAFRGREPLLLQVGWPSASGGEAAQAAFVARLPALLAGLSPQMLLWPILHDIPVGPSLVASLGLYRADGGAKPAAARFLALRPPTPLAVAAPPPAAPAAEAQRRNPADTFAIYTATLAGTDRVLLVSDPWREINHARVSPDGTRFVFTRYNRRNREGQALEVTSYLQTEIVICRMDGGGCTVAVPPRPGIVAANATWTPDGSALLFVTNDRPSRRPGVSRLDLATGKATPLPAPGGLDIADPNERAGMIVVAGRVQHGLRLSRIYQFDPRSGAVRPLTQPAIPGLRDMDPPLGDHDPKLSPDGRRLAVMRHLDTDDWAIVVVDLATGAERDLSGPHPVDAVPEWSGDGQRLIFWHVERGNLPLSGLYTMRADGSDRRWVPLPHGFFYSMPAFLPGQGSGPQARIIYSAKADPGL